MNFLEFPQPQPWQIFFTGKYQTLGGNRTLMQTLQTINNVDTSMQSLLVQQNICLCNILFCFTFYQEQVRCNFLYIFLNIIKYIYREKHKTNLFILLWISTNQNIFFSILMFDIEYQLSLSIAVFVKFRKKVKKHHVSGITSSVFWTVSAHFFTFALFKLLKHFSKVIYKILYFFYVTQNYL